MNLNKLKKKKIHSNENGLKFVLHTYVTEYSKRTNDYFFFVNIFCQHVKSKMFTFILFKCLKLQYILFAFVLEDLKKMFIFFILNFFQVHTFF